MTYTRNQLITSNLLASGDVQIKDVLTGKVLLTLSLAAAENLADDLRIAAKAGRRYASSDIGEIELLQTLGESVVYPPNKVSFFRNRKNPYSLDNKLR